MPKFICWSLSYAALWFLPAALSAQAPAVTRPNLVLQQAVQGMPMGATQELSVMTADFKPGDRTVFHTHRFPVTVYILQGEFTLELEGRSPITIKAGQAFVEPPQVRMTGFNRSANQALHLVIFYVSEPGMPFLDLVH